MKLITVLASLFLFASITVCAQSYNLNIASENGQRFTLYVNNVIQNRKPLPAVNVLTKSQQLNLKIVFADKNIAPIDQRIRMDEDAAAYTLLWRHSRCFLRRNVPFLGGDIDDDDDAWTGSTTGTTTSTGNGQYDGQDIRIGEPNGGKKYLPNGSMCPSPNVDDIAFVKLKKEVSDAYYNSRKAAVIKRIFENNCMLAAQVAGLVKMLNAYSSDQLDMAKLGYLHMYDTENFDEVISVVGSQTHKKELEDFAATCGIPGQQPRDYPRDHPPVPVPAPAPEPGYCQGSRLNSSQFNEALQSIKSSSFEQTKFDQAKLIAKTNCFSIAQIREIIRSFDFEETKLNFAKFAYDHTYEKGTYYLVNQEFDFESSKTELTNYISQRK